jgi:hypothetical protein
MVPVIASLATMLESNAFETCCTGLEESVTCTAKLDAPVLVGVPLMAPFLLKVRPTGNVPDTTVHEYGSVPPEVPRVDQYAVPTTPFGNEAVVIFKRAPEALMLIEKDACAVSGGVEASETCTAKLNWPEAVGVPLITPVVLDNDNPDGNPPDAVVKLYGAVPPVAFNVAE